MSVLRPLSAPSPHSHGTRTRVSMSASSAVYRVDGSITVPPNVGPRADSLHEAQSNSPAASGSPTFERPSTSASKSKKRGKKDGGEDGGFEDDVAVGTKISEGHTNYVLMYDMLTGIRNAVSRCVAKPYRPLEKEDFTARHKITFDILGNELTPSSKYEFKFKDYAPWVFRYIREHFNIEAADYLVSLTSKYVLSELGSPGKSGSFFYFSQDYRFIIKTIHHSEHKFLMKILEQYYEHIQSNPNTLLCRYYGLHRVKLPHGRKIHFVVMGNVLPPNKDIHETFDLKGSLIGREVSEEEHLKNPGAPLKDLNWLALKKHLYLGPEKRKPLIDQLEKDSKFLMSQGIMDYSLLTGIHYLRLGNSEKIRDQSLSVFEPDTASLARHSISSKRHAHSVRRVIASADPIKLGPSMNKLPEDNPAERRGFLFYQDDGGFLATDENNGPLFELYYIGIIDVLTKYNFAKMAEHAFKSLKDDKNLISAVEPKTYGERFMKFMKEHVVGTYVGVEPSPLLSPRSDSLKENTIQMVEMQIINEETAVVTEIKE